MYKHQFVKEVAVLSELTDRQVRTALIAIKEVVRQELVHTGEVNIPGLVHLKVLLRKERLGRNLGNGERQIVASGYTIKSRPTGKLASEVLSGLPKNLSGSELTTMNIKNGINPSIIDHYSPCQTSHT